MDKLAALRHNNGKSLGRIYGPVNTHQRGGTIALNFYDSQGHIFEYHRIEALANQSSISLGTTLILSHVTSDY